MDLKIISELIKLVSESKLTSLEVEEKELRIKLEKNVINSINDEIGIDRSAAVENTRVNTIDYKISPTSIKNVEQVSDNINRAVQESVDESDLKIIKAPIVGTFYSASSPDSESFVTKGKKVKKGDTLCIIEAMKLMNEIESEFDGEIVEILVENGAIVEYGQPLFKMK